MQQVNPNRMELQNQKKKLTTATKGHKLLKDKQDALIKIFLEEVQNTKALRLEVEKELTKAYSSFLIARASMQPFTSEVIFATASVSANMTSILMNHMGVWSPKFDFSQKGNLHVYGLVDTSGELDSSLSIFSSVLEKLVLLSEKEKQVEIMATEIEQTRRRVNALEYSLIPQTKTIVKYIKMKLDENERSDMTRLMKVKDIVRKE